jgi:genome maintenance exonuclease 1
MKTKIHTVYKLADGTRVPSVTTILGVLNKPALLQWAWQCGVDGLDYKAVRDDAANVGTLAHYLILCHLKGETPDTSEYSPQDIERAENCLIKYWDWEKEHDIKPILVEEPLVSYEFGGTIDCLAEINGELVLIDFKTSKALYQEMFYQLAAYRQLLREAGYNVINARILRIGREDTGDFEERIASDLDTAWQVFEHCLQIYQLSKKVR